MMTSLGATVRGATKRIDLTSQRRGESNPKAIAFMILLWLCLFIAVVFLVTLDRCHARRWVEPTRLDPHHGVPVVASA